MICSKCGNEVSGGSKFCTYCAAPLDVEADAAGADGVAGAAGAAGADDAAGAAESSEPNEPSVGSEPTVAGEPVVGSDPLEAADDSGTGTGSEPAADSLPKGFGPQTTAFMAASSAAPPPGTPPQSPFPPPGATPPPGAAPPYGATPPPGSPPPYAVATPIPPVVEPKKSKAPLVVGIVAGVVLLCCICCAVVGWFIYDAANDTVTSVYEYSPPTPAPPTPTPPTPTPPNIIVTPPPDPQDQPRPPATVEEMSNPKVVIDNDMVKVTIDAGTRIISDAGNFIDVYCLVENKTDKTISLVFQEGAYTVDGYKGGILIIDKDYEASEYGAKPHFLPGETAPAALAFDRDKITGDLKNLKGALLVYNAESLEDMETYHIELPEF